MAWDPYGILIGKAPKLFLVTWIYRKFPCGIIQCLIWCFTYPIEVICISTGCFNYNVHVMTCPHKFIISWQCSIFIELYESKFLIMIPQFNDKEFEDLNGRPFSYGYKYKGVWSGTTYSYKGRGKSTYAFNI